MLLWPLVAFADKQIEAGPPNRFTTGELTMDQGERLVFRNGDTVSHDVTATVAGPDGKPLFGAPVTAAGKESFVEGSQYLTEGHYDYVCSLHNGMKGTIHVTANGTPQVRPDTGAKPDAAADKTKPRLKLRVLSRTTVMARARHALIIGVDVSEPSHVELRAVARPKAGGKLVTIARKTFHKFSGSRRVHVQLTPAGVRALRRDHSLAIVVNGRAIDPSGNMSTANHGRTLTA
jgi:plastocyanin